MTIAEIIQPGDKVDISFVQNVERAKKDQSMPKIYKSQVLDLKENGNLEISMPVERGKLVLLPLGIRMEFIFFSKGTLYRAVGQVRERYKRENVYMLEIELKSQISKYQRREFFRFPCIMDMNYYTIEEQEAALKTGEALFIELQEAEGKSRDREYAGRIVDLSGGGLRFRTDQKLRENQYVLFEIHLQNENLDKQYYIIGTIISCIKTEKTPETPYEARAKFLITDSSVREEIIRFIFEEERKARQRGRA